MAEAFELSPNWFDPAKGCPGLERVTGRSFDIPRRFGMYKFEG